MSLTWTSHSEIKYLLVKGLKESIGLMLKMLNTDQSIPRDRKRKTLYIQACYGICVQTPSDATSPIGRIHQFSKVAVTFEPMMQFLGTSGFWMSKSSAILLVLKREVLSLIVWAGRLKSQDFTEDELGHCLSWISKYRIKQGIINWGQNFSFFYLKIIGNMSKWIYFL